MKRLRQKGRAARPAGRRTSRNMPKWSKSPPELVAFFKSTMDEFRQAEVRTMFGYPCAFVNGNLATGLHGDRLFVRLSPADASALLRIRGASPFDPMPGRVMRGYVVVPSSMRTSGGPLTGWIEKSLEFVSGLPSKKK